MRRILPYIICFIASVAAAEPAFKADFENGAGGKPVGWQFAQHRGKCNGVWDETEPPPRGRSIRLDITEDAGARATWTCTDKIAVKPSTSYRLSFGTMLAEVTPDARCYLIAYENGVEDPAHWHTTPRFAGTQDWHTCEIRFTTRPDATWLRLQCKLWEGTGYAWFDDILIEESGAAPEPVLLQRKPPPDDGSPVQLMWYPAQRRPDNTLCLLAGSCNPVAMFFWGKKEEVKEPYLLIEAPVGLNVVGPVVHGTAPMPAPIQISPQPFERDGGKCLRWRIPIPCEALVKGLKPDGPVWSNNHFVYVEPQEGCPAEFEWRWQVESAGRPGPAHGIPARIVARYGGTLTPVPDFALYAQHSGALRYPTREGRERILAHLFYAGIRGGLSLTHWQPDSAPLDKELNESGFFTWAWKFDSYGGAAKEDQQLLLEDGTVSRKQVCPQAQVERGEPWWPDLVAFYHKPLAPKLKTLIIDFEPPCFKCCFCPRCREAFAKSTHLDAKKVMEMSPKEIQALPGDAWGRFRAGQNAAIVKNHVAAIHALDPEVKVGICSSPYSPYTAQRGMDLRLFEPEVAFHAPMIYSVGDLYEQLVRSTCENTKAPVLPFLLASDLAVPGVFPLPDDVRMNMLATAFSGGRGAVLWVGIESLDGEYMNALRRSLEEIRGLQGYIIGGSRAEDISVSPVLGRTRTVKVNGKELSVSAEGTASSVRSWSWRSPRGRLLGLINYDRDRGHSMRLSCLGIAKAKALLGPAPAPSGGEVVIQLAPYEAAALTW